MRNVESVADFHLGDTLAAPCGYGDDAKQRDAEAKMRNVGDCAGHDEDGDACAERRQDRSTLFECECRGDSKSGQYRRRQQSLRHAQQIAALPAEQRPKWYALEQGGPVLAPFGAGVAVFVMAGAITDVAERTQILRVPLRAALQRAIGLPRSAWGTAFAHFGLGVTLLGIVAVTAWGSERISR